MEVIYQVAIFYVVARATEKIIGYWLNMEPKRKY